MTLSGFFPFGGAGPIVRRPGIAHRLGGSPPGALEQTIGKRNPEYGEEEAQYDIRKNRYHLVVGGGFGGALELNHALKRPGKTFQAEHKSHPCPHFRDGPRFPPQKPTHSQSPSHNDNLRDSAPENPKPDGGNEGSQNEIWQHHMAQAGRGKR